MSQKTIEDVLEGLVRRTPLSRLVDPQRCVRFFKWAVVGATGTVIDLGITLSLLGYLHYLLANVCGFLIAVSFNFTGNYVWTYDKPNGNRLYQYLSFVSMHVTTFTARILVIILVVEWIGLIPAIATIIGVAVAAVLNFTGNEVIFGGNRRIWLNLTEGINHLAFTVYNSRVRTVLVRIGLYNALFLVYAKILNTLHRSDTHEIAVNGAIGVVATEYPTETVGVYHCIEEERPVLEQFVSDLRPDDTVVDVGANVGIYSVLAGDIVSHVVAIEPYGETAKRCSQNLQRNDIAGVCEPIALGESKGTVHLDFTNKRVGTTRAEVSASGTYEVPQWTGDELEITPDVLKIDVEGAERQVLNGYTETLRDIRVIYIEAHSEPDAAYLSQMLGLYGFTVETIHQDANRRYLRAERDG